MVGIGLFSQSVQVLLRDWYHKAFSPHSKPDVPAKCLSKKASDFSGSEKGGIRAIFTGETMASAAGLSTQGQSGGTELKCCSKSNIVKCCMCAGEFIFVVYLSSISVNADCFLLFNLKM